MSSELGRQIQQHGDQVALGRLVQANLRMVVGYAKRFRHLGVPLLDLIHEGNLGLIEAARRFDPRSATDFQIIGAVVDSPGDDAPAVGSRPHRRPDRVGLAGRRRAGPAGRSDPRRASNTRSRPPPAKRSRSRPLADAEDFAAHLHDEGRRKSLRKARKRRQARSRSDLQVLRQHSVLRGYLN